MSKVFGARLDFWLQYYKWKKMMRYFRIEDKRGLNQSSCRKQQSYQEVGDFRKWNSSENFLFTTPGTTCWLALLPSAAPPATPSLLRAIQGVGLLISIWLAAGGEPFDVGSPSRLIFFFFVPLLTDRPGNSLEDQVPAQFLSGRCECVRARHNPYLTGSMKGPFRVDASLPVGHPPPPSHWWLTICSAHLSSLRAQQMEARPGGGSIAGDSWPRVFFSALTHVLCLLKQPTWGCASAARCTFKPLLLSAQAAAVKRFNI